MHEEDLGNGVILCSIETEDEELEFYARHSKLIGFGHCTHRTETSQSPSQQQSDELVVTFPPSLSSTKRIGDD
jgi:hypothetical protein